LSNLVFNGVSSLSQKWKNSPKYGYYLDCKWTFIIDNQWDIFLAMVLIKEEHSGFINMK